MLSLQRIIFGLFLTLSVQNSSAKITSYIKEQTIYIASENCKETIDVYKALVDFAERLGEKIEAEDVDKLSCELKEGRYHLEVTRVIPPFIREILIKVTHPCHGPNCYNAALYFNKLVSFIRNTNSSEFLKQLEASHCQKIDDKGFLQPGDIGLLNRGHTFIYLTESDGLDKRSNTNHSPYSIRNLEEIITKYDEKLWEEIQEKEKQFVPLSNSRITPRMSALLNHERLSFYRCEDRKNSSLYELSWLEDQCDSLLKSSTRNYSILDFSKIASFMDKFKDSDKIEKEQLHSILKQIVFLLITDNSLISIQSKIHPGHAFIGKFNKIEFEESQNKNYIYMRVAISRSNEKFNLYDLDWSTLKILSSGKKRSPK